MKWTSDLAQILGVEYPIIQAPMLGVTTPQMVAAALKAKTLGSLSLGDLPAEKCAEAIGATRKLTDKPFAVNIFLNEIPAISEDLKAQYALARLFVEQLAGQHQLEVSLPPIEEIRLTDYHDQIDAIIAGNCKIVSFTFGNLDAQSISKLKAHDTLLIGTCTSVEEALILERSGIDLICVQGFEAGGHRGSFAHAEIPKIGGMSLLPQVYDAVKVPLIYAGGIYNARTLLSARALGAQGFQVGSILLGSEESALQDFEKERLRNTTESGIVLTRSFSGRYARGVRNTFIDTLENSEFILPYPYQNKLTTELRKVAKAHQNADFVNIWAGQSLNGFSGRSTTAIIQDLIAEFENL